MYKYIFTKTHGDITIFDKIKKEITNNDKARCLLIIVDELISITFQNKDFFYIIEIDYFIQSINEWDEYDEDCHFGCKMLQKVAIHFYRACKDYIMSDDLNCLEFIARQKQSHTTVSMCLFEFTKTERHNTINKHIANEKISDIISFLFKKGYYKQKVFILLYTPVFLQTIYDGLTKSMSEFETYLDIVKNCVKALKFIPNEIITYMESGNIEQALLLIDNTIPITKNLNDYLQE